MTDTIAARREAPGAAARDGAISLEGRSEADRRLLIVDDDAPLCQRLARAMEKRGFPSRRRKASAPASMRRSGGRPPSPSSICASPMAAASKS